MSAAAYDPSQDQLWLQSDQPDGALYRLSNLRSGDNSALERVALLASGDSSLDGEGLVVWPHAIWVASEGRRDGATTIRPPQLLRFARHNGAGLSGEPTNADPLAAAPSAVLDLPSDWQPGPQRGLANNAGPESLVALPSPGEPRQLLMAAERPLLQDPPDRVRVLRWQTHEQGAHAEEMGALKLPPQPDWGVTDLLVWPALGEQAPSLLVLLRRFEPPARWHNRLALYPLPAHGRVVSPWRQWDLHELGLTPENWEALSWGPPQPSGQPTLLLVSDDNLNPWQQTLLAQLVPQRPVSCQHQP